MEPVESQSHIEDLVGAARSTLSNHYPTVDSQHPFHSHGLRTVSESSLNDLQTPFLVGLTEESLRNAGIDTSQFIREVALDTEQDGGLLDSSDEQQQQNRDQDDYSAHEGSPVSHDVAALRRSLGGRPRLRRTCHICGRECPSRHKLQRHLSTHSEDRPYNCRVCGKAFKWTEYLSKHMRTQHGPGSSNVSNSYLPEARNSPSGESHCSVFQCSESHCSKSHCSSSEHQPRIRRRTSRREEGTACCSSTRSYSVPPLLYMPGSSGEKPQARRPTFLFENLPSGGGMTSRRGRENLHSTSSLDSYQSSLHESLPDTPLSAQSHNSATYGTDGTPERSPSVFSNSSGQYSPYTPSSHHLSHVGLSRVTNTSNGHYNSYSAGRCHSYEMMSHSNSESPCPQHSYTSNSTMGYTYDSPNKDSGMSNHCECCSHTCKTRQKLERKSQINASVSAVANVQTDRVSMLSSGKQHRRPPVQIINLSKKKDIGIQCEVGDETIRALFEDEHQMMTHSDIYQASLIDRYSSSDDGTPLQHDHSQRRYSSSNSSVDGGGCVSKYPCEHNGCDRAYVHRKDLVRHMKVAHGITPRVMEPRVVEAPVKPFNCSVGSCGRSYYHLKDLRRHQRQCHPINATRHIHTPPPFEADEPHPQGTLRYPCDFSGCMKSYIHKKDLIRHKRMFHHDTSIHPSIPDPVIVIHVKKNQDSSDCSSCCEEERGSIGLQEKRFRLDSSCEPQNGSLPVSSLPLGALELVRERDLASLSTSTLMENLGMVATMVGMEGLSMNNPDFSISLSNFTPTSVIGSLSNLTSPTPSQVESAMQFLNIPISPTTGATSGSPCSSANDFPVPGESPCTLPHQERWIRCRQREECSHHPISRLSPQPAIQ